MENRETIVVCQQGSRDELSRSNSQRMWLNQIQQLVKPAPVFFSYCDAAKEIKKGGVETLVVLEPNGDKEIAEIEKLFPEVVIVILTSDGRPKKCIIHSDWFLSSEQLGAVLGGI